MARTAKKKNTEPAPARPLGVGFVLPPGVAAPVSPPLEPGKHAVKILSVDPENGYDADGKPVPSENQMVKCEYPDGSVKNHQVNDVAALAQRAIGNVRGRHGLDHAVAVSKAPKSLKADTEIELEVSR